MSRRKNRDRTNSGEAAAKGRANPAMKLLSTLLIMYVVTGAALLVLALLLYKLQLSEKAVSVGIMAVYVAAGLLGGFIAGKRLRTRRFLWGLILGAVYFAVLLAGSFFLNRGLETDLLHMAAALVMCMASGMIGGMLS